MVGWSEVGYICVRLENKTLWICFWQREISKSPFYEPRKVCLNHLIRVQPFSPSPPKRLGRLPKCSSFAKFQPCPSRHRLSCSMASGFAFLFFLIPLALFQTLASLFHAFCWEAPLKTKLCNKYGFSRFVSPGPSPKCCNINSFY